MSVALYISRFNSMIVRLKARTYAFLRNEEKGFNSMIVRLKGGLSKKVCYVVKSFNSMIVRLKGCAQHAAWDCCTVSIL